MAMCPLTDCMNSDSGKTAAWCAISKSSLSYLTVGCCVSFCYERLRPNSISAPLVSASSASRKSMTPVLGKPRCGCLHAHVYRVRCTVRNREDWTYYGLVMLSSSISSRAHGVRTTQILVFDDGEWRFVLQQTLKSRRLRAAGPAAEIPSDPERSDCRNRSRRSILETVI
jgi:hypothetical protein